MKDSTLKKEEIDDIVLIGGSSRIPRIQKILSDYFNGKTPSKKIHPDEAVALGAALQADMLNVNGAVKFKKAELLDILS